MKHLTSWGSHVEIQAASWLLGLPIYVCTRKDGSGELYWEVFKDKELKCQLKFPESKLVKPAGVWHYELCHTQNCHYDIICMKDRSIPRDPPPIKQTIVHAVIED